MAQCRVRRRENCREQCRLPDAQAQRQGKRDERPSNDRQGHADQQHADGKIVVPAQLPEVNPRRIGEQHQYQRDFGKAVDEPMSEIEVGQPENGLANQQAEGSENHRCCNDRAVKFPGDEAKQNDAGGNKGKAVCVHEVPEDPPIGRQKIDLRSLLKNVTIANVK